MPCARFAHAFSVPQTISEAYAKRVSGATLISMVNSDRLGELGISRLKRTQLLWNIEVRIDCERSELLLYTAG